MNTHTQKLPREVAQKYKMLPGHGVGEYYFQGHKVDLSRLSLAEADQLAANHFPYLVVLKASRLK